MSLTSSRSGIIHAGESKPDFTSLLPKTDHFEYLLVVIRIIHDDALV